jgi:hypothetical protein
VDVSEDFPPTRLLKFAPPYTGVPVINAHAAFGNGLAVHAGKLVVTGVAAEGIFNCSCGEIDVFTLPLAASSAPVRIASPSSEDNVNPYQPAFDASGRLYVPWQNANFNGGIDVYTTLTARSLPAFTIHNGVSNGAYATAIGP